MKPLIPVTIVSGYLGAGKTTLVNHLLRQANGLKIAVMVNDFGALPIDADLIEADDGDIISIAGGCVCCSYGDDLSFGMMALKDMQPPPDHVLLEASGIALPGAIRASVGLLNGFENNGIIALLDAETLTSLASDKYVGDTVMRQIRDADILVLNKTDLAEPNTLGELELWLAAQNPDAISTRTTHSNLPLEALLGARNTKPSTGPTTPHHQTALIAETLSPLLPLDAEAFAKSLATGGFGLLRAKGFVTGLDGRQALIQITGKRWQVTPAKDTNKTGVICLGIKGQIKQAELKLLLQV